MIDTDTKRHHRSTRLHEGSLRAFDADNDGGFGSLGAPAPADPSPPSGGGIAPAAQISAIGARIIRHAGGTKDVGISTNRQPRSRAYAIASPIAISPIRLPKRSRTRTTGSSISSSIGRRCLGSPRIISEPCTRGREYLTSAPTEHESGSPPQRRKHPARRSKRCNLLARRRSDGSLFVLRDPAAGF